LINHQRVVTKLTTERIAQMAVLIEQAVPLELWPSSWSAVNDNIQHAGALLGTQPAPGVALAAAMARQPQGMLDEIKQANLRGCGGAGYATASKWQLCRDTPGQARYVVCNADEGEPGTFKDRVLLASFADTVFEGMSIAAWATGAQHGLLYLRGEYCFLLAPLQAVLQHRRQQGLLGKSILGQPGFDFDIQIHVGAGAYVCGEESALIESLQGRRGTPGIRPPYPAQRGYLGLPTVVNNVETLCAVSHIAWRGARWWTGMGTAQSSGSKIHSISGDCARPGLYEYAYGTSVQHMLLDCGAQCTQAVQIGGPSGVCVSASEFARSICFEDLASAGAFMVFDESRDMFEVARSFAQFFAHESCGFCTPCRVGSELVLRQLDKIQRGHGGNQDLAQLSQLGQIMQSSSHCGLGASAGGMLQNSISKFPLSYQRRLSRHFVPGFDLDAELSQARLAGARHVAATHLQTLP
jgi:[NiFe] hydrogenase diaphorase moiety large subunit